MAKKKKLSKQQLRRLQANRTKKISQTEPNKAQVSDESLLGEPQKGLVISRFGQHADIENDQGELLRCDLRRTVSSIVAGDRVIWRANLTESGNHGVIEAVEERNSVLTRPDFYDGVKSVAANIDQIIVLSSILPELSFQIIDRYLVAIEQMGAEPIIVINKSDLIDEFERLKIDGQLDYYREIGYQVHWLSVKQKQGTTQLAELLKGKTSILVGQSGVGKSSLVNQLLPDAEILIGDVSDVSGLGMHTTTVARLYHLASGGDLIDSPGIREFALWHLAPEVIFDGFIEFEQYRHECKFRDCKHLNDPGCALKAAVQAGKIKAERLENYHKILESVASDKPAHKIDISK
ncbi:small ribosomal subunit biogenesis GTPase RsgA [Catenovulum maritimum]|uniref:Small ribosomal subunit biogenesis GTPase RsgA n=1 Tax=Catenovulum maritimum TaxID=1513271 RepID=A0A0J8GMQ1_9ALTE|nr:small ribosomal subunit biogenesis GTPase RsgA [Catenovulum maritimum]KMT64070.1 GTPase RsgA [Catenovulum maritimum]